MIEREAPVKIYSDVLGAKGARGRLVRVAPEGYYEITLESGGRQYTGLLPIASTVILAADAIEEMPSLDVER
ncbi:MAG: hypothetical protein JXO72_12660 [Vicinamibacteria bacterium]|nr:hypothetical protein [Vicinamibacteria bacterium]